MKKNGRRTGRADYLVRRESSESRENAQKNDPKGVLRKKEED